MANKNYPKSLSFSTTIPFDQPLSYMPQQTITGAVTFGKQTSNSQVGFGCLVRLVADGSHVPDLSGFALEGPGVWVNTNGTVNKLFFYYDGSQYCVIITQPGSGGTVTDVTPPNLVSATATDGSHISVVFDEAVNVTTPGWGVFVEETGITHSLTSVSGSGANWTFVVGGSALLSGQTLGLIYTAASGNTLDTAGNELSDVSNFPVTNSIGGADTTAPTLVSATAIDATHVTLVFSENVVPSVLGWTLHDMTSITNYTFASFTGGGTTWTFFIAGGGTLVAGHTLNIDYSSSVGNTVDGSGNEMANLIGWGVINGVGGGSYDSTSTAFFTAAGITDTTQKNAIDAMVVSIKGLNSGATWAKFSGGFMYPYVGGDATKHSYNLIDPATFQITWHGSIIHDASGVKGDGSTGYGDTGLNPSTIAGGVNTVSIGVYQREALDGSGFGCGMSSGTPWLRISPQLNSSSATAQIGNYDDRVDYATPVGLGLHIGSRESSTLLRFSIAGTSVGTNTTANTNTLPNGNIWVLGFNQIDGADLFNPASIGMHFYAPVALTASEEASLATIIQTYQTALSRNV